MHQAPFTRSLIRSNSSNQLSSSVAPSYIDDPTTLLLSQSSALYDVCISKARAPIKSEKSIQSKP